MASDGSSSSDSESGSSDSRSSSAARRHDRRERKRERRRAKESKREKRDGSKRESGKHEGGKQDRREKKRRRSKGEKKEKKEKRHKRDKEQVYSALSPVSRVNASISRLVACLFRLSPSLSASAFSSLGLPLAPLFVLPCVCVSLSWCGVDRSLPFFTSTQVQRSIITGKRIHRRDGDVADAEGEARRAALLAHMNEGEGVVWEGPAAAAAASSRRGPDRSVEHARSDPAVMRRLLEQGQEASASKRARLGALVRSDAEGYTGQ
jgi:hypothetical protein